MCGIYGFKVKAGEEITPYEATVLGTVLAKEMEWRGRDSWGGVIFPHPNATDHIARIFRGIGSVTKNASNFLRAAYDAQSILGHTRAATVGKVSQQNAHPFLVGDILGVHNGGISNYDELNKKYDRKYEVDSQQIFAHINEGLDLSEIEGYGTFFYTKRNEGWENIYLARTSGGSLCLARLFRDKPNKESTNFFALAWASEKKAIESAAGLLDVEFHEILIKPGQLYTIKSDGDVYDAKEEFKVDSAVHYSTSSKMDRNSTSWYSSTSEPTPYNVKNAPESYDCPNCTCNLRLHSWGVCKLSHMAICKVRRATDKCKNDFQICRSCGCYLVEDIHEIQNGKVHCRKCTRNCRAGYESGNTDESDCVSDSDCDTKSTTVEPFQSLSKKARKRLLKKVERSARNNKNLVPPMPKNIRPIETVAKTYRSDPTVTTNGSEKAFISIPICSKCICDLDKHIWGWCNNNGVGSCKANNTSTCENDMPICADCGCYMVETIHTDAQIYDQVVWCVSCNNYCATDEPTDEDKELHVVEAEVVTTPEEEQTAINALIVRAMD